MANVLDQEWQNYIIQSNETEKKSVLQMLKVFLKRGNEDAGRITIDQYNKEIEEALEEVKRGEVSTHEEVVKLSKNW